MCPHHPECPTVGDAAHEAARVVAAHPEQGWSLLCNGVVLFDDTGELLPDGAVVAPHRWRPRHSGGIDCPVGAPRSAA